MNRIAISLVGLWLVCGAGCGSADPSGPTAQAASSKSAGPRAESPPRTDSDPESVREAVKTFLSAIQKGDSRTASEMLTKATREKSEEMGVEIAPPGSPTASFEIGEIEFKGADGAYVATRWTDDDGAGGRRTDNVVWMVRRVDEGWRICGLGTKVFEDQPPLFLNFEDPQDMARKHAALQAERERRVKAGAASAAPKRR